MPDNDLPSWVDDLLRHPMFFCNQPDFVKFRQGLIRERILETINSYPDGTRLLHAGACQYLQHAEPWDILCALTSLFVIGTTEDVALVEPFLRHSSNSVRKAAQTCLFEIKRRV